MKILIVEDSEIYRKLLKKNIDKYLVFARCDIVKNFEELKKLQNLQEYDLFLCDYLLPDSINAEHIKYILKFSSNIIVMTQFEKEFINSDLEEKVIDFIVKDDFHTIDYLIRFIKHLYRNRQVKVLIVDKDKNILDLEKRILNKININVIQAQDGLEALEKLKTNSIDLILTDLIMPKMDGQELLLAVREKYNMTELPVIVLSSDTQTDKFLKTLKLGANDFLGKPFLKEELILRVNNLLEICENIKKVKRQLQIDPLTGAYNRMFLEGSLENIFNINEKKSIVMIDIDHFKKINDTYGHQIGDEILIHFVNTIKNTIRKSDLLIRYGGEEFMLYMPDTTKEEAMIVMYKIRKNLRPCNGIKYSFSAGIADEGETLAEMVKIADRRLYKAKYEGRNKIIAN
ncbi:diguanylate cyclase [Nautilia profundicola AmH]|uniref:diguanylate cyclase n=1 Tax=Nautilia profundicola (strain ATCC BAA-1463 / DSM 18972 / AmH) TaxID=598659 RepID=B9L8G2_NAUPA|nr:diguanylate cyclase [Nautilia profundicola]ACM93712.1 diguanylate cyclase [Nautilia profundicola AmH]